MVMRGIKMLLLTAMLLFGGVTVAAAASSKAEAKAMVDRAVLYIRANGDQRSFEEFTNRRGKFVEKDLYIFAIAFDGEFLAHGGNHTFVGKNMLRSPSDHFKRVTQQLIESARSGGGWVRYQWPHPITKVMRNKASYLVKVNDRYFIGCGVYEE
jgi:signal transduction histidine kinase